MADEPVHLVAVIGAGPAGLFAARALAATGARVVLLNRDIKPGGLAEYGIFLNKYKMKGGLRRQFHKILTDPLITYLGHVTISNKGDLTVPGPGRPGLRRARLRDRRAGHQVSGRRGRAAARRLPRQGSRLSLQPPAALQRAALPDGPPRGDRGRRQRDGRHRELLRPLHRLRGDHRDRAARPVREGLRRPRVRGRRGRLRPCPLPRGDRAHPAPARGGGPEPRRAARRARGQARAVAAGPRPPALPLPGLAQARAWPREVAWSGSRWRRTGSSARATASSRPAPARPR